MYHFFFGNGMSVYLHKCGRVKLLHIIETRIKPPNCQNSSNKLKTIVLQMQLQLNGNFTLEMLYEVCIVGAGWVRGRSNSLVIPSCLWGCLYTLPWIKLGEITLAEILQQFWLKLTKHFSQHKSAPFNSPDSWHEDNLSTGHLNYKISTFRTLNHIPLYDALRSNIMESKNKLQNFSWINPLSPILK